MGFLELGLEEATYVVELDAYEKVVVGTVRTFDLAA